MYAESQGWDIDFENAKDGTASITIDRKTYTIYTSYEAYINANDKARKAMDVRDPNTWKMSEFSPDRIRTPENFIEWITNTAKNLPTAVFKKEGDIINLINNPSSAGYTLEKWYTDIVNTGIEGLQSLGIKKDLLKYPEVPSY